MSIETLPRNCSVTVFPDVPSGHFEPFAAGQKGLVMEHAARMWCGLIVLGTDVFGALSFLGRGPTREGEALLARTLAFLGLADFFLELSGLYLVNIKVTRFVKRGCNLGGAQH